MTDWSPKKQRGEVRCKAEGMVKTDHHGNRSGEGGKSYKNTNKSLCPDKSCLGRF